MKHTLVALLQNRPGALQRAVTLFRRRNFTIESLAVGQSEIPDVSRLTVVVDAEDVEQVTKQFYRLVEVLKVTDLTREPTVEREIALIKIHVPRPARAEVVALAEVFGAKVVDVGTNTMVLEVAAYPTKVQSFVEVLRPFGIKEMMRSGRIAMLRGALVHAAPDAAAEDDGRAAFSAAQ